MKLVNFVLGLIIAVICLGILVFWGFKLYNFVDEKDKNNAEDSLNELVSLTSDLREGEERSYSLFTPRNWFLVYYGLDSGEKIPRKCKGKNCLCACPVPEGIDVPGNYNDGIQLGGDWARMYYQGEEGLNGLGQCENLGICKNVDNIYIEKEINYRIWNGLLKEDRTGIINWVPFEEHDPVQKKQGNEVFVKKVNGRILISDGE